MTFYLRSFQPYKIKNLRVFGEMYGRQHIPQNHFGLRTMINARLQVVQQRTGAAAETASRRDASVRVTHGGKEHGEDVDGGLQQVVAPDGDGHGGDEHEVTEAEQQGGEQLEAVGVGLRVVCAPPALPA